MTANITTTATDLDSLYAPHVTNSSSMTGIEVGGVDIRYRYDVLESPDNANAGSRIPFTEITAIGGVNLSSIFCGNTSQYSVTTPAGSVQSVTGWTSPEILTYTLNVTFSSPSALQSYFYYGGRIIMTPTHTTGTTADNALSAMFANMGSLVIYDNGHYVTGAGTGGTVLNGTVGGTNIGSTSTDFYSIVDTGSFSASTYKVSVTANAPASLATVITITTVLDIKSATSASDTYTGTYSTTGQQRNYPTQTAPTFSSTINAYQPVFIFSQAIASPVFNYDLRAAALSAGWNGITPLSATVTVNSGINIGSYSSSYYAFSVPNTIPGGSTITINNYGNILGLGGSGGYTSSVGGAGGPAMYVGVPITFYNLGRVGGGGGGGGGGGTGKWLGSSPPDFYARGGGGGGGAGYTSGAGGGAIGSGYLVNPTWSPTAANATPLAASGGAAGDWGWALYVSPNTYFYGGPGGPGGGLGSPGSAATGAYYAGESFGGGAIPVGTGPYAASTSAYSLAAAGGPGGSALIGKSNVNGGAGISGSVYGAQSL